MLRRVMVHLSLVILFAFTQMGVATHEISHFSDSSQQSQHDQTSPNHQCAQCLVFAELAVGLISTAFLLVLPNAVFATATPEKTHAHHLAPYFYSSRAPPQPL